MPSELKRSIQIALNLLETIKVRSDSSFEIALLTFHADSLEEVRGRLRKEACSREAYLKVILAQIFLWHTITRRIFEDRIAEAAEASAFLVSEGPLKQLSAGDLKSVFGQ